MNTLNTPKKIGRNTKMCPIKPPKRARSWCYTWNNYTEEDWNTNTSLFDKFKIKKMVFQEEKGKNGTRHIQGFIQFENAINFTSLKKIHNNIHWEVCKNIPASINYCSKKDTRSGRHYMFGCEKNNKKKWIPSIEDKTHIGAILEDMHRQMLLLDDEITNSWNS